ncbi:hypothetical protein BGX28_001786 [Mortierella sp. GBA30]|nr:hypothetical protein BGX28_001786 [Mortierella sp. GBA30]
MDHVVEKQATNNTSTHAIDNANMEDSPEATLERLAASYLAGQRIQSRSIGSSGTSTPSTPNASSPSATSYIMEHHTAQAFSGFSLHLPPTSSSTPGSPQDQFKTRDRHTAPWQENDDEDEQANQKSLAPKPLAVKPAYKKRETIPTATSTSTRSDGILRLSASQAATEKRMLDLHNKSKTSSRPGVGRRGNIYDKAEYMRWAALEQDKMTRELKKTRSGTAIKKKPSNLSKAPKIRKLKVVKPLPLWKPRSSNMLMSRHTSRPGPRSYQGGLIIPSNREAPIESLSKQREIHKERLAQLASRPMPLKELHTLITAELNHELEVLNDLGIQLHKELLKLQLEEGVLINMNNIAGEGVLDTSDLVRVKPYREPSKSELRKLERANRKRLIKELTEREENDEFGIPYGLPTPSMYQDYPADERDREEEEERGEGEEEGVRRGYEREPIYQQPGEAYGSRPLAPSLAAGPESSIGQPKASAPPATVSFEHIVALMANNGRRKSTQDRISSNAEYMDVDMQEVDYEEEEEQEEEEDEDMSSGYDEDDEDEDDHEDGYEDEDEAARKALQQMLSMYGSNPS